MQQNEIAHITEQHKIQVDKLKDQIQKAHQIADKSLVTLDITERHIVQDDHFGMEYYLMLNLAKKGQTKTEKPVQIPFNPFLNPQKQLLIKQMGPRHHLLFNKFNIYRNHLLVVTKQFQSQKQRISEGDMLNASIVRQALDGIIFFNGGDQSGASQRHKHVQIIPKQAKQLPIFKKIYQFIQKQPQNNTETISMLKYPQFNFLHGIITISHKDNKIEGHKLFEAYNILHEQLIDKNKGKDNFVGDYNIIACETFILMAMRKQQNSFDQVSVNSLGFMGSLLFKSKTTMEKYISDYSPSLILEKISQKPVS